MMVIFYLFMILFGAGMFYGMIKHRQGYQSGRVTTIICVALVFCSLLAAVIYSAAGCGLSEGERIAAKGNKDLQMEMEGFGAFLSKNFSGYSALLVMSPTQSEEVSKAVLDALNAGLAGKITIAQTFKPAILQQGDAVTPTILNYRADKLEAAIAAANPQLVISLIGLPEDDFMEMEMLKGFYADPSSSSPGDGPKLALKGGNTQEIPGLENLIRNGYVHAVVLPNPDFAGSEEASKSMQEYFAGRFVTATKKTVSDAANQYPRLFPSYKP